MNSDTVTGKNSVTEALKSGVTVQRVFFRESIKIDPSIQELINLCKDKNVRFDFVPEAKLKRFPGAPRDVAATISPIEYVTVEELVTKSATNGLVVILDQIEDPHNLGAIIRTCLCFGTTGIVIPKDGSCQVNNTVVRASAGAVMHLPIARVVNISRTIETLKENGFWIYGTSADARDSVVDYNFPEKAAIVIGSEGSGIRKHVAKRCDVMLSIPIKGAVTSLNASVSTAIVVYEASKRRF
ncbi:MAG TPA: 23S rRNA (guanosine(2251)-2'-O)-methyltransferase RlmB [Caldisericia bacterium]|nr:23S rRNA (guanosine(2251)-2'-O)-methyltransferase RlmB [Caldisericia bacterium]HPF48186.1 23S rRNA (guanosine(2251)-2'-O)-methyltransferase RlmB [Caldisericia bacterium]HPI83878.1 23S rRNA (guanosine(2251)-2'-O)-methyltransferase RlmB [Caldisericia bacterium]HPQ92639.1 23S rRNA (guanosine(2251)-2'-O)-methyltransferase RlmB [Caldisericia bacterium]HRV74263.1 23S rRNA (guanosine(2251)-2'-O)-methyltransferase RlmB [Caldisericia bacterium]